MLKLLVCKSPTCLIRCNTSKTAVRNLLQKIHISRILENDDKESKEFKLPEEPQNCCMSGCANCVWIDYAEKLAEIFQDGGETARQKITEHVKDPNLQAFIMMELDDLFKDKKNSQ